MRIETRELVNGYRVPPMDSETIGDWGGHEEQAARQFVALCERIAEALPPRVQPDESDDADLNTGAADDRQGAFERLCAGAWEHWGVEPELLALPHEAMERYAGWCAASCAPEQPQQS